MGKEVSLGRKVTIANLGTFRNCFRKARKVVDPHDPRNKSKIKNVNSMHLVKFKPGRKFKKEVKKYGYLLDKI